MSSRQQITKEIKQLGSLQALVQAYAEIAAVRVVRVRHAVLANRAFMEGLHQIYETLKNSYRREILLLLQKRKLWDLRRLSLIRRNGRTAFVFLSANTGLYGDLMKRTYDLFRKSLAPPAGGEGEIVITGKWGAAYFREDYPGRAFTYFDLPDHKVDGASLARLSQYLLQFEKVIVFHGRFENVVSQKPYFSGVSGEKLKPPTDVPTVKYLFEPSLEEILNFFEGEIFASLLVQSLHESLLAKFAARMLNLDAAAERIKNELGKAHLAHGRLRHRYLNSKQLGSLAGLSLWERHTFP